MSVLIEERYITERRRPLRERFGEWLIVKAHRIRRTPDLPMRLGDWQEPQRGFLVHGRCGCGWWAALPEGGVWPHCPNCGEQVMPPIPEVGNSNGRMGFAARFLPEQEALRDADDPSR